MIAYYTDPLAAAWMAQRFGMRFNEPHDFAVLIKMYARRHSDIEYFIHEDSLYLLDPRVGDVVMFFRNDDFRLLRRGDNIEELNVKWILSRQGVPFIMPQIDP